MGAALSILPKKKKSHHRSIEARGDARENDRLTRGSATAGVYTTISEQ